MWANEGELVSIKVDICLARLFDRIAKRSGRLAPASPGGKRQRVGRPHWQLIETAPGRSATRLLGL